MISHPFGGAAGFGHSPPQVIGRVVRCSRLIDSGFALSVGILWRSTLTWFRFDRRGCEPSDERSAIPQYGARSSLERNDVVAL